MWLGPSADALHHRSLELSKTYRNVWQVRNYWRSCRRWLQWPRPFVNNIVQPSVRWYPGMRTILIIEQWHQNNKWQLMPEQNDITNDISKDQAPLWQYHQIFHWTNTNTTKAKCKVEISHVVFKCCKSLAVYMVMILNMSCSKNQQVSCQW